MEEPLQEVARNKGFRWTINPANSPWRQGKVESRIKIIKRLLKIAIGESKLTPLELQTAFFEVANLSKERPIRVHEV